MSRSIGRVPLLLLLVILAGCQERSGPPLAPFAPDDSQIVRFARQDLHHPFSPSRLDGFVALAYVETRAAGAIPDLEELTESDFPFERLLAVWTLERIGTRQSRAIVDSSIGDEPGTLDEGSIWNLAGRVAILAARQRAGGGQRLLDPTLPRLYNAARGERLDEKLVAAWALYEIGTPGAMEVADKAVEEVASSLDPDVRDLSRLLSLVGLIGWRGVPTLGSRLEELLVGGDWALYEIGLVPRRAQVARALAQLSHPIEPESVRAFKQEIRQRLSSVLDRSQALEEAMALGPWACAPELLRGFESVAEASSLDDEDRQAVATLLDLCSPGSPS